jgi:hypothetical protein
VTRRCNLELEEDTMTLVRRLAEVELEVQKMKTNKMKIHRDDMRNRDGTEPRILVVVGEFVLTS